MSQINHIEVLPRCSAISSDATEFLWLELLVDDKVIVDFKYYAVDLDELTRSIHSDGDFFIITCWCGDSGCVGIEQGIQVTHGSEVICWKATEPKQFNFTFDQKQYETEVRKVIKQAKQLLAEAKYAKQKTPEIVPMQNEQHFKLN